MFWGSYHGIATAYRVTLLPLMVWLVFYSLAPETSRDKNCAGLFWQLSWDEWNLISPLMSLSKEEFPINAAEFLAALITIETFVEYCKEKITILGIDNTSAKA